MALSLKNKAIKGVSWNLIERFGLQSISVTFGIILARLLTPEDFGLIGMITVFFAVAQVFINSGFGAAYIQKKEVSTIDANTVFFTNLSISIILYWLLWYLAPTIANFYGESELIKLTRIMGLVVVINAFNVIQIAQISRNVDFKRKTKVTLVATILSGTSGMISAYCGLGVWSIVIQQLGNRFLVTSGLWITNQWKPTFHFSSESFRSMFSFGAWILISNIITTLFANIYILTIGKYFPTAQLGFYTKSKSLSKLGSEQLSGAVNLVAFPIFSKLRDNNMKFKNSMSKFLKYTMFLTMPILVTLMVVAKPFVLLLLTEKWEPMIPYLQLLCIVGIFYPINNINRQALLAMGKSNLNFRLTLLISSLRIINIVVMHRFGIVYLIIGETIVSLMNLFISTFFTKTFINYGILRQWNDIKKIFAGIVFSGVVGYFSSYELINLWLMLIAGTFITLSIFIVNQYLFNRSFLLEILSLRNSIKAF